MSDSVTAERTDWLLRVTDLKQYAYCPRIVYYEYCLPGIRPTTFKMEAGIGAQDRIEELEKRRSLRAYGIEEGERFFNVTVQSAALGCSGQVDLVVKSRGEEGGRLTPVDFKLSRHKPGTHFKLQLACYALMLEESWQLPAPEVYIYLIPKKQAVQVTINARLRGQARRKLAEIREIIQAERMPPPTGQRRRCVDCEFRRFCGDVL